MNRMLLRKRVIIDFENKGCPEHHITLLLEYFEDMMAKAASISCHRASYTLAGRTMASQRGLDGYSLEIERMLDNPDLDKSDQVWTGAFTNGESTLEVMGCLEEC